MAVPDPPAKPAQAADAAAGSPAPAGAPPSHRAEATAATAASSAKVTAGTAPYVTRPTRRTVPADIRALAALAVRPHQREDDQDHPPPAHLTALTRTRAQPPACSRAASSTPAREPGEHHPQPAHRRTPGPTETAPTSDAACRRGRDVEVDPAADDGGGLPVHAPGHASHIVRASAEPRKPSTCTPYTPVPKLYTHMPGHSGNT